MGQEEKEEKKKEEKTEQLGVEEKKKKRAKILYILLAIFVGVACFFSGFFVYSLTLDEEIRELIRIKNKIQKEYYQEITDEAFYDAVFNSVNESLEAGTCASEDAFYKAVYSGINDDLLDPYSEYLTEEEYQAMRTQSTGRQSGIGAYFLTNSKDLLVYRVAGNSPAETVGLQKGDVILGVGESEETIRVCEERNDLFNFLNATPFGETFYMQWRNEEGVVYTKALKKSDYVENYVYYKTNESSYGFSSGMMVSLSKRVGEPLTYLREDTAYIQIIQFNGNAETAFDSAMQLFKEDNKRDLIIDLRDNGGGYINIMQGISKYFCKNTDEKSPVVAIADYGEKTEKFKATGNVYDSYFSEDSRIMVLANNNTASASECLIGCMYSYGATGYADICLIEINGEATTYGKGIMQTTFPMYGGGALKLTTAEILWPLERRYGIHGRGVTAADGTKTTKKNNSFKEETKRAIAALYA